MCFCVVGCCGMGEKREREHLIGFDGHQVEVGEGKYPKVKPIPQQPILDKRMLLASGSGPQSPYDNRFVDIVFVDRFPD